MVKVRETKRNCAANNIAKEVRYQYSNFGKISDNDSLYQLLIKWMELTGNEKYERPKQEKNKHQF